MEPNKVMALVKGSDSQNTDDESRHALDIRIITHNIRYATSVRFPGEECWSIRCPRLCSQLVFNSTIPETFICLQEVLHQQLVNVLDALNAAATDWCYIGVGRDDGKQGGEYSPIFYRPSIWRLTEWKTRWLSKTPDVPSKGWDAVCIRIATIGHFTHLKTGRKVVILSTHFDNKGTVSRRESAKLILREINSISPNSNISAVLLAGDLNSPVDDGAYQVMTYPESVMQDVGLQIPVERRYGNETTFTSFGHVDNTPSRIDFIFARKNDDLFYRTYGVLSNRFDDGVYLSDHRACVADVVVKS